MKKDRNYIHAEINTVICHYIFRKKQERLSWFRLQSCVILLFITFKNN